MEIYMTYETLYRKYRSNDLSELVGQQHVIQTLSNAIRHDRLSHAYIFSGPRGTGKTSTARILAKMVNKTTENIVDCDICNKITAGNCIDVIDEPSDAAWFSSSYKTRISDLRTIDDEDHLFVVLDLLNIFFKTLSHSSSNLGEPN